MTWARFLPAIVGAALTAAGTAYAQSSPAGEPAPKLLSATLDPARIEDILVSQESGKILILVRLSQQPTAASVAAKDDTAVVQIEGLSLAKTALTPRPGSILTRVEASESKLTLAGAALSLPTTVIYRNAVLIEARLAEPVLKSGTSLLDAPSSPPPLAAPSREPAAAAQTAVLESKPAAARSKAAAPGSSAKPADQPPSTRPSLASLAKIDAGRCAAAAGEVTKDPWAVKALGEHALCLFDAGRLKEAQASLDQLAAFAPDDWRVALGQAALAQEKGDASKAEAGYRAAAKLAPDNDVRAAITTRITPTQLSAAASH